MVSQGAPLSAEEPLAKRPRCDRVPKDPFAHIRTPCYVVDVAVAKCNAAKMLSRCKALGVSLRPHVKTHKTLEAALLQTGGSRRRITVSTLAEARFFADGGFDDILYAVPITPDKLPEASALTARLELFMVVVDHADQLDALLSLPAPADQKLWNVVIMVDCGYGRDGVDPSEPESLALARRIQESSSATLAGVYTHGGHSYDAKSVEEVRSIGESERDAVVNFARKLREADIPCHMVGIGSTPTCSNPPEHLEGVTEMHPGNYIYYDAMQAGLGSCALEDVAVRVCTRVVGHYRKQNTILVDLGWTGISQQGKERGFGAIDGHPELRIRNLKQEAGEVTSADNGALDFTKYPIGSVLQVIPWHSCASTHQHTAVHVLDQGRLVARWQQVRGW